MDISLEKKSSCVLVRVGGRLDSFNFETLQTKINTLLRMGKIKLALDARQIDFANLTSLLFLKGVAAELKNSKGYLALVSPSENLLKLVEGVDTSKSIRIVDQETQLEFEK